MPADIVERSLHIVKHRGPRPLLRLLDRVPPAICERDAVQVQIRYFRKRESLMQYPSYRAQGWPIGSGIVESANKLVVQARLKGAGMHWAPAHVNPMLALRTSVCNDRWDESFQQAELHQIKLRLQQRRERAHPRLLALASSLVKLSLYLCPALSVPPPPIPLPRVSSPPAMIAGTSRPSPHHPWKRALVTHPKGSAKK
ncbi:hypothetical protein [Ktedonobacter racemifer]|nr:hypothetical protein [Ktedonobacter racemifer]